eukprot:219968-Amphidinium_carterae.1
MRGLVCTWYSRNDKEEKHGTLGKRCKLVQLWDRWRRKEVSFSHFLGCDAVFLSFATALVQRQELVHESVPSHQTGTMDI